jgi:hypothetical protein
MEQEESEANPTKKRKKESSDEEEEGLSPDRDHELDEEDHNEVECGKHNFYDQDEDKFVNEILGKFLIGTESSFLD